MLGAVSGTMLGAVSGPMLDAVSGPMLGAVSGTMLGAVSGPMLDAVSGPMLGAVSGTMLGAVSGTMLGAVSGMTSHMPLIFLPFLHWSRVAGSQLKRGWEETAGRLQQTMELSRNEGMQQFIAQDNQNHALEKTFSRTASS